MAWWDHRVNILNTVTQKQSGQGSLGHPVLSVTNFSTAMLETVLCKLSRGWNIATTNNSNINRTPNSNFTIVWFDIIIGMYHHTTHPQKNLTLTSRSVGIKLAFYCPLQKTFKHQQ